MEKEDESEQFTLLLLVVVEVPAKYCYRTYLVPTWYLPLFNFVS